MKVLFTNDIHYSLLVEYSKNTNNNEINDISKEINNNIDENKLADKKFKFNFNTQKLCILENNPTFYDNNKTYLQSLKIIKIWMEK